MQSGGRIDEHAHSVGPLESIKEHYDIFRLFKHILFRLKSVCFFFFNKQNREGHLPLLLLTQTMIKFMRRALKYGWGEALGARGGKGFRRMTVDLSVGSCEVGKDTNKDLRNTGWTVFVTYMIQLPLLACEEVDKHLAWELHEANQQGGSGSHPHNNTGQGKPWKGGARQEGNKRRLTTKDYSVR